MNNEHILLIEDDADIRDIQAMFLEAGFIGFLGGIAGVVLSYLMRFGINAAVAAIKND